MLLMLLLVNLLLFLLFKETQTTIIFSTIPKSKNVSQHSTVTFACSTSESGLTLFTLSASPPIGVPSLSHLPDGDKKLTLTITDTNSYKSMHLIICTAIRNVESNYTTAFLKIQGLLSAVGNLNHTGIVNCSVLITWTAPYTLQGVPIHYYTINITRHSDGAVVWSDTTNTTEYHYSVISQLQLGETLEAVVAAVNDVGTGATANITIHPLTNPITIYLSVSKVIRSGEKWHYSLYHQIPPDVCQIAGNVFIETCLKTTCENISASIDDNGVIQMMANLTRQRIYSITILIENNGIIVQESHPIKLSEYMNNELNFLVTQWLSGTFDVRNISIAHPVTNGQVCLSVEYVEGHDPNPSCFVMFRCIATAGHDMSTVINGTMMCVHLSPQVYTIVATDTIHDINTTTPPVIIYNVTVPSYYPETSSSMLSYSTALISSSQFLLEPTESATTGAMEYYLPITIFISLGASAAVLPVIVIVTVTILGCVLWRKKRPEESRPKLTTDQVESKVTKECDTVYTEVQNAAQLKHLYESVVEDVYESPNTDPVHVYEELPLKTLLPRNKIKVGECPAYGQMQ